VTTTQATQLNVLFAERLTEVGVKRVYGFPGGGSNLEILEALADVGIRWVLAHTEMAAGLMACADAEATDTPGVLLVGNGPGLASSVGAVAHAWLDRVPLIVVSDRYTESEAGTTGHQILDQLALLAPVVKFSARFEAEKADEQLRIAFDAALTAPRGPVHLDLPRDQATAVVRAPSRSYESPAPVVEADSDIDRVATRLRAAQRPVLLIGLEANRELDPDTLKRLADLVGAAVFTTYKAKGTYPERDDRWAGLFTGAKIESELISSADMILTVGLDQVELLPRPWPYEAPVLSLREANDPADISSPAELWVGNLAIGVEALVSALQLGDTHSGAASSAVACGITAGEVTTCREAMLSSMKLDGEAALPSWRVVEMIAAAMPDDSAITVDAGAHMFPATTFMRPSGPRRFSISSGLATMGYAVPAAIATALANPTAVVVALTGDGGTAYNLSELETAARLGAKVIVVVFNDASLSLIRIKHEANGYGREPLDFSSIDFATVARGFNVTGTTVTTATELQDALDDALARNSSSVIDVRVTGREYSATLAAIRG
jgi:acetolactate synthase-1/2/3 large subunit